MQGLLDLACSGKGKAYRFVLATCSAEDLHWRMTTAWGHQSSGEVFRAAAFVLGPASSPCYTDTDTVPAWASCQAQCKHCCTGYTSPAAGCRTACYTYPLHGAWLGDHTCHPCVACSSGKKKKREEDLSLLLHTQSNRSSGSSFKKLKAPRSGRIMLLPVRHTLLVRFDQGLSF